MASMNLLGFSLSPQEQHNTHHHQTRFGLFNPTTTTEDDVTAHHHNNHGNCFDLTTPTLNNLPPFPIYEEQQPFSSNQDWKDQNLLLGTSCSNNHHHQQPKLENFLGGHSFADHHQDGDYIFQNCSTGGEGGGGSGGGSTNSIGLSMIKTWLRNQPLHHHNHSSENNKETMVASSENNNNNTTAPTTTTNSVQTLSLSMSTGHGSLLPPTNTVSVAAAGAGAGGGDSYSSSEINSSNNNKQVVENGVIVENNNNNVAKKSIDTFGQRTSIYRGVTRHRWTGRYEAHLWDNSCRREGQTRKGRQVYLGGYDKEEKAARAYDLAALKYWGTTTTTNFPISQYEKELEEMKHMTRQEYVASLRRKSSGFSRGASIYRGVTRHHQHGRWQARIGRVAGNKDLYLGTFSTQEEAAEAYDIAAIKFRGLSAVTNFDMSRYDVKSILESSTLPIGGAAKRLKDMDNNKNVDLITNVDNVHQRQLQLEDHSNISINSHHHSLTDGINNFHGWPATLAFQQHYSANYGSSSSSSQRLWCKQEQDSSDHNNFHQEIHPLQLGGGGTHNFFQHGIMSMDHSASMDNNNSSGSSSVVYGGGDGNGYVFPMGSVIGNDSNNEMKGLSYESVVLGSEAYNQTHGRHFYYQQQSSTMEHNNNNNGVVVVKGSPYDHHHQHHGGSNNWVPTAIPTIAASRSLCHGAPPFSLLHE